MCKRFSKTTHSAKLSDIRKDKDCAQPVIIIFIGRRKKWTNFSKY